MASMTPLLQAVFMTSACLGERVESSLREAATFCVALQRSMDARQLQPKAPATKVKSSKQTKLSAARKLYQESCAFTREEHIEQFVSRLNMSRAGAITYLAKLRKEE